MYYIAQTVFTSNDLQHYGVAGMKWGHHNAKSQNGTDPKAQRNQRLKTAAKVAGATALAGAAAYGAYKGSKYIKAKNLSNQGVADYYNKRNHAKMSEYYTKKAKAADSIKAFDKVSRRAGANGIERKNNLGNALDLLNSDKMAYKDYAKQAKVNGGLTKSKSKYNYASKQRYSSNNYRERVRENFENDPYTRILYTPNGKVALSQKELRERLRRRK